MNTKLIGLSDFQAFFGQDEDDAHKAAVAKLPALPIDVLQLPDAYRSRVTTEKQIADLLVGKAKLKTHLIAAVGM